MIKFFIRIFAWLSHEFKVRYYAKPFDIHKECQADTRGSISLERDWISYDNKLYYGHPLFIFFESAHNSWWHSDKEKGDGDISNI